MRTVSKRFFSNLCGVTPAAITKALKSGKITLEGKFVNLDDPKTAAYLNKKKGIPESPPPEPESKAKSSKKPKSLTKDISKADSAKPAKPAVSEESKPLPSDGHKDVDLSAISDYGLGSLDISQLDRLKTIEQTLKIRQQREAARGDLIPRSTVKIIFNKLHAVDNSEFKTMEDRLTPAICGIFGEPDDSDNALEIRKMLNNEIIKILRHSKRIINDYLQNTGSGVL
ncbi:MAG: hypothetical protein V3V24_09580 [Nitrospinaceae bacterium]